MTWASSLGMVRDLAFHAFYQDPANTDHWVPLVHGSFHAVQEEARHFAARHRCRVIILALEIDAEPPDGVTEKVLLRRGVPWY